jgi:uncharacterized membrane protein YqaE (UPF0057 family)
MSHQDTKNNVVAIVCACFVPGLGHAVQRRFITAALVLLLCLAFYVSWFLVVTGIIAISIHLWSIFDVVSYSRSSDD